jgi:hypothetical protein
LWWYLIHEDLVQQFTLVLDLIWKIVVCNIRDVIPFQEHQWMQNLKFCFSLKFQVQQPETLNLKQKTTKIKC